MRVESSIKENYSSTTVEPITDIDECIKVICEWNGISLGRFKEITWSYVKAWVDNDWQPLYLQGSSIINPIGVYLMQVYDWKDIVFEKWDDKFFWTLRVRAEQTRYMLGDKVIDIPFRIKAVNEETEESITIFPKTSDIVQRRMRWLYVVSPGWAERQRIEKEIMAKLIELAQVKGWNEIIWTQNIIEELQKLLKKSWIDLELCNEMLRLDFPRRKIRDTAGQDNEYIAPPITVEIDFMNRNIKCKWYSPHWFGTPSSRWNPCRWNWDNDIHQCLQNCSIKELINLIVIWSNGYNSRDTWTWHNWRHPIAKLRDYMWYLNNNKDKTETKTEIEKVKEHLAEVKQALEIDDWLEGCQTIKDFISSLEWNNETAE